MTPPAPPDTSEHLQSATRLVQYVTVHGRCERYLRLVLFPSEGQALMYRYGVTPEALSPLLTEAGSVFKHATVTQLAAEATVIDLCHRSTQECIDAIRGQTALDESFRLLAEVAAFLHSHIYAHDGRFVRVFPFKIGVAIGRDIRRQPTA
jgi:hypothetical protein